MIQTPTGANTLNLLLKKITINLKVIAIATEPEKGIELIENYKPDVVFLDINMPRINGFELLERLHFRDFKLVFSTAHDSYAIKAIKSSAMDYLIKPIDASELTLCVNNILQSFGKKRLEVKRNYGSVIELAVRNGIIFIKTSEIIRLEVDRSYTVFYLLNNIKHKVIKEQSPDKISIRTLF
jgi:two-component system LytT family response regulator